MTGVRKGRPFLLLWHSSKGDADVELSYLGLKYSLFSSFAMLVYLIRCIMAIFTHFWWHNSKISCRRFLAFISKPPSSPFWFGQVKMPKNRPGVPNWMCKDGQWRKNAKKYDISKFADSASLLLLCHSSKSDAESANFKISYFKWFFRVFSSLTILAHPIRETRSIFGHFDLPKPKWQRWWFTNKGQKPAAAYFWIASSKMGKNRHNASD